MNASRLPAAATAAAPAPAETTPVALHPERTDDPGTIRWQVTGPALDGVTAADVRDLARHPDGTTVLAEAAVDAHHVLTTLAPGRSWATDATVVRAAVRGAVQAARDADHDAPDTALERAALRTLDEVAPYAAGHGGGITLARVADGVVEVEMHGACHGCPAAAFTVQGRVTRRLRQDAPWLREVRVTEVGQPARRS